MRVGIMTFHDADNYGAVLQAYGLKKSLSNYVDCEIINYYNDYFHRTMVPGSMSARIVAKLHQKAASQKARLFKEFRDQYLTCGSAQLNDAQLERLNGEIDLFVSGSDQVWNPKCSGGKKCYFLSFVKENTKKVSYAASFGTDTPELDKEYKKLVQLFHKISVREGSGCTYIRNEIGRESVRVLDPTLLLKADEWSKMLKKSKFSEQKGKYIVIYEVVNGSNMRNFAINLSKEKKMPVYCITASNRITRGIKAVRNAGPVDWIDLIKNSAYVITNSFHGMVFSLIFNKQFFVELLPHQSAANTRILEMLSSVNLQNRLIGKQGTLEHLDLIDYEPVNCLIDCARKDSILFIQDMLGVQKNQTDTDEFNEIV